jgi:hypothetical protein
MQISRGYFRRKKIARMLGRLPWLPAPLQRWREGYPETELIEMLEQVMKACPLDYLMSEEKLRSKLDRAAPSWRRVVSDPANWEPLAHYCGMPISGRAPIGLFQLSWGGDVLLKAAQNLNGAPMANHFMEWGERGSYSARLAAQHWYLYNGRHYAEFCAEAKQISLDYPPEEQLRRLSEPLWIDLSTEQRKAIVRAAWVEPMKRNQNLRKQAAALRTYEVAESEIAAIFTLFDDCVSEIYLPNLDMLGEVVRGCYEAPWSVEYWLKCWRIAHRADLLLSASGSQQPPEGETWASERRFVWFPESEAKMRTLLTLICASGDAEAQAEYDLQARLYAEDAAKGW